MKKFLVLLTVCAMMVACGGNAEKKEKKLSVREQTFEYCEKMLKAVENDDMEAMEAIAAEVDEWYESLTPEQQEEAAAADVEWAEKNEDRIYGEEPDEEVAFEDESDDEVSVAEIACEYSELILVAMEDGDMEAVAELASVMQEWYEGLTPEQQEEADAAAEEWEEMNAERVAEVM